MSSCGGMIKFSSGVVEEVVGRLKIDESRFINCCLLGKDQGKVFKDEMYFPVDLDRYAKAGGVTKTQALAEVEEICIFHRNNCLKLSVRVGNSPTLSTLHDSLIYSFIVNREEQTITINWNKKFIPYISGEMEAGKFITINPVMDGVSSNRRYCMYLLLTKYLWKLSKQPSFSISEEEIRQSLHLINGEYKEFKSLNEKVVKPTLEDVYKRLGRRLKAKVSKGFIVFSENLGVLE